MESARGVLIGEVNGAKVAHNFRKLFGVVDRNHRVGPVVLRDRSNIGPLRPLPQRHPLLLLFSFASPCHPSRFFFFPSTLLFFLVQFPSTLFFFWIEFPSTLLSTHSHGGTYCLLQLAFFGLHPLFIWAFFLTLAQYFSRIVSSLTTDLTNSLYLIEIEIYDNQVYLNIL